MRKLLCTFLSLLLLTGCAQKPEESLAEALPAEASTDSITYHYGFPVFPFSNRQRTVALYPDGTATLMDKEVIDESKGDWYPWPTGEEPTIKHHSFYFPAESYLRLEQSLFAVGFFDMDKDLGVNATDMGYDTLYVEYGGETYAVGASGWPEIMEPVMEAYQEALDAAYLDSLGNKEPECLYPNAAVTQESVTIETDGSCSIHQSILMADGTYTSINVHNLSAPDEASDPFALLIHLEDSSYTMTHTIPPQAFNALIDAFLAEDFFNLPEQTDDVVEYEHPDGILFTQRYTLTLDGQSHTITLPPNHVALYGETYDRLSDAWYTATEEYVEDSLTIEDIFAWR